MSAKKSIQAVVGLTVVGFAVVALGDGCGSSSSSGASVDFTALQAQYSKPTGKLSGASDVQSAASQYSKSQTEGGGISSLGGLSEKLGKANGIKLQGGTGSISEPCSGGGTFSISGFTAGGTDEQASIDYANCDEDSETINGTMSFDEISATQIIYSGSITITPPGDTVDLNFELDNGQFAFSATISSGNVVVASESAGWDSSTNTGSISVTDSQGMWSCTIQSNSGNCTGPGSDITWPG